MTTCTGTTEYSNGEFAHSWEIEEAMGPTSKSVCRTCGAKTTDKNSIDTPTTFSYQYGSADERPRAMNDF